jgi:DNA repair protein RadA
MVKGEKPPEDKKEKKKPDDTESKESDIAKAIEFDIGDLAGVGAVRKARLVDAGINNPMDLIIHGSVEVAEITGMDRDQAEAVVATAREYLKEHKVMQKTFQSGREKLGFRKKVIDKNRISAGCKALDDLLGGGFEPQAVTEFYGVYGSGKTQICHTAAVMAQLPRDKGGLEGEVLWIDTENTFRPERIKDIVIERGLVPLKEKTKKSDPNEPVNDEDVNHFLDKITVATATNAAHQIMIVDSMRDMLKLHDQDTKEDDKTAPRVVLIIVDSLTTHFRVEYTGRGLLQPKQSMLNQHIHKLLKTAEIYNIAVVFTNQVIANPEGFGVPIKPVGGNVLAHASTYRIYLKKSSGTKRIAKMDDSPMHEQKEVVFQTTKAGAIDNEVEKI